MPTHGATRRWGGCSRSAHRWATETAGLMEPFRPHMGPQDRRGNVAIPPKHGPPTRHGRCSNFAHTWAPETMGVM